MKLCNFIFLHRKWEKDQIKFERRLKRLNISNHPYTIVFYPEGTTICQETMEKSQDFAIKMNEKSFKHVLYPRSLGLRTMLCSLDETFDGIIDLTVGYSGILEGQYPDSIYGLSSVYVNGISPPNIHMHYKYYPSNEIPYRDEEKFVEWLNEKFREKDILMEYFLKNGKFPGKKSKSFPVATKKAQRILIMTIIFVFVIIFCKIYFFI